MSKITYAHRVIPRFFCRPSRVDCRLCRGHGVTNALSDDAVQKFCLTCCKSGLDVLPWTELFKEGRHYGEKYPNA